MNISENGLPPPPSRTGAQIPVSLQAAQPAQTAVAPAASTATGATDSTSRLKSLYTQWRLDEEDSDDDDGFATPSEGLSDLEEEDEEESAGPNATSANGAPSNYTSTSAMANVNIAENQRSSSFSEGPKVTRTQATGAKVTKRHVKSGNPADVDQTASLPADIDICREVLSLFLRSRMKESEILLEKSDPHNNHLYLQSGHGIIQTLKGLMTFDAEDIGAALEQTKGVAHTSSTLRRPTESVLSKLRPGASVQRVRHMTVLELHAELVYAETILLKAILGIVGGGDWLGLIREAFNMRTAHGIYRTLQMYLEEADANGFDEDIDMDFRSGVLLGTGTSSLMLSLLPGKVLKIAEVFGYAGNREVALSTLMSAGGWSDESEQPAYNENNEGIRRPICDMILLTFHLVISVLMPVAGVDIAAARKILAYNMRRYPDGIFFLYFQARLHTNEGEPESANKSLQRALDLDLEYIQLQHMCLWDYGCNYLQLTDWNGALQCFDILRRESNWSRAVYTYAMAVNVMELINDPRVPTANQELALELVSSIPKLTKKIAGKSLPIEKLAARKARKFLSQGNRLFLPAMELAYVFGSLGRAPRRILIGKWLPRINAELAKLEESTPETWGSGEEYWDDFVLGHFLRAVVHFTARYQPSEASESARAKAPGEPSDDALDAWAEADFKTVIENAPRVKLDHYILFHNHYELGRLYARRGDATNAMLNFNVVMNNKLPVANSHVGKGKYSLEGALQIKTHAAIQALQEQQ